MVPESHEILFQPSAELREFFKSPEFENDIREKLRSQNEVDIHLKSIEPPPAPTNPDENTSGTTTPPTTEDRLVLTYTRNNAGGLKDAIDFLIARLVTHGLDAATVKGAIPRPKSDSFEESLPFFDSKLLQHAPAPLVTDSPTRSNFGDDVSERGSLFEKLRKPGSISSFTSFIGRKNQSASPGSFFKHASSNASKASLVSMESRDSGYRNPWNDSGVNLPEEEGFSNGWPTHFGNGSHTKFPFGNGNGNGAATGIPGDTTPVSRHEVQHLPRSSFDSGRPSTSNSMSGNGSYLGPGPIGPPR
jgi:hypothetical protein